MSTKFLPPFAGNAALRAEELLPAMQGGSATRKDALEFSECLRRRGIAEFFMTASVKRLVTNLRKSGRAFLYWLSYAPDEQKLTSKAGPFFDAIAGDDSDCAAQQARAARAAWDQEREYEEDFLYVRLLMSMFFLGGAEVSAGMQKLGKLAGGSPQAGVLLAFAANDAKAFDAALTALLAERADRYATREERGSVLPEELVTEGQLSVEGLALLRLADLRGFKTQTDYLSAPSLARKTSRIGQALVDWTQIY